MTCYLNLSGLPHPPAWIKVVARGADNVSLEWSVPHECHHGHVLHCDGFIVFIKERENAEWKGVTTVDHYVNKLVVTRLSPDKGYFFGVAGFNEAGVGDIVSTESQASPEVKTSELLTIDLLGALFHVPLT